MAAIWSNWTRLRALYRQLQVRIDSIVRNHRRHQGAHLRGEHVELTQVRQQGLGSRRSSCRCRRGVEHRPDGPVHRDVGSSAAPGRSSSAAGGRSRRNREMWLRRSRMSLSGSDPSCRPPAVGDGVGPAHRGVTDSLHAPAMDATSSPILSMSSSGPVCRTGQGPRRPMPRMNGMELCSTGVPSGLVMVLHLPDPWLVEHRPGDSVDDQKSAELRRSWSLWIISSSGLSRAAGDAPRRRSPRRRMSGAGSAGRCSRCGSRAARAGRSATGPSPRSGSVRASVPPPPRAARNRSRMARLGSSRPKWVATVTTAGPSVKAASTTTTMPMANGMPERVEHRAAGEVQAEHGAGDGQPGTGDHVGRCRDTSVVGRLLVLPLLRPPW